MSKIKINPSVWIIIVNWNGLADTIECLESLAHVTYSNYEVVVVDNGSKDNQAASIKSKFPKIHIIKNAINTGFVVANNQGIEYGIQHGAEYVMLLNNDTVVDPEFIEPLVNQMEQDATIGASSPKILYYKSSKIWSMGGTISIPTGISIMIGKRKESNMYMNTIQPDFLTGCAFLVSAKVVKEIGMLDPIYFAYYEDVDWSYRIRKAGYKIITFPQSVIYHKKSASAGIIGSDKISPVQAYYISRNALIFANKNLIGIAKIYFTINQFTFHLLFAALHFSCFESFKRYILGLKNGLL